MEKFRKAVFLAGGGLLIGAINHPLFYRYPFLATIPFILLQAGVIAAGVLLARRDKLLAFWLILFDLYSLFLSSKVLYFSRAHFLRSELFLEGKPTLFFFWFLMLSAVFLWGLLVISAKIGKTPLLLLALLLISYNLYFFRGRERFVVKPGELLWDGYRVVKFRHRVSLLPLSHAGKLSMPRGRLVIRLKKARLYGFKNLTILRTSELVVRKEGFFLRIGAERFLYLIPWPLLEFFLLPLALFPLILRRRLLPGGKYAPYVLIPLMGTVFFLQAEYFYRASPRPFLYFDTWEYVVRAESLLRGFSYGEEILVGGNGPCHWPPGAIIYNALFIKFFSRNWHLYILLRTLLFIMFLIILYNLARKHRLHPPGALLMAGLSGYTIYYASVESEGIFLPVFFLALYLAEKREVLSGFLLGISSLVRPFALGFSVLWAWVKARTRGLLLLSAFLLTVLPWIIRCSLREGRLVIITRAGPVTLLEGNSPFSTGGWKVPASIIRRWKAMGYGHNSLKDIVLYNLKHPGNVLRLLPRKIYWAFWEEPLNRQWHPPGSPGTRLYGISLLRFKFFTPFSEALKIFLYFFALLGMGKAAKEWEQWKILLSTLGGFVITVLVFFGLPRYTSPFVPLVYLFFLRGIKDEI